MEQKKKLRGILIYDNATMMDSNPSSMYFLYIGLFLALVISTVGQSMAPNHIEWNVNILAKIIGGVIGYMILAFFGAWIVRLTISLFGKKVNKFDCFVNTLLIITILNSLSLLIE